jgi:hypothetical protein
VWHGDTYNELRQSPVLYSIFAQLLKTHRLVTTIDRYLTYAHAQSQCHKELQLPPKLMQSPSYVGLTSIRRPT